MLKQHEMSVKDLHKELNIVSQVNKRQKEYLVFFNAVLVSCYIIHVISLHFVISYLDLCVSRYNL